MKILIETSPLISGHSIRGVGAYTRFLTAELEKLADIELMRSSNPEVKSFKPDLIHYPFFDLFFNTLPLRKKTKTIVTIHDLIPLVFSDHYKPGKKGFLRFLKQRFALKSVDIIITDSEASKKDIVSYLKIKPEKIEVVYLAGNPFLKATNDEKIGRARKRFSLPTNYLLYVGDINYNKNLPQLIKSLKFLPPTIKLVCVGKNFIEQDIPEWRWIKAQIALSDVENRVKFISDIQGDDYETLSAIYSAAVAYVQPSLYEGFGLPILEAMQCRTPVISTNNSSLVEVGGQYVVYTETNAESIAAGVETVLNWSTNKRAEVIREAYKWSQKFSWQKTATETMNIYQKVSNS